MKKGPSYLPLLNRVIVALDNLDYHGVEHFLNQAEGRIKTVKIGLELFYRYGPAFVRQVKEHYPVDIFLDLKLHDIPNTVAQAIYSLQGLPVRFLTIHLSGGPAMIQTALQAAANALPETSLLGVAYLTSLSPQDLNHLFAFPPEDFPQRFALLARRGIEEKIPGLILSPQELPLIEHLRPDYPLLKITPGVRFADEIQGAQTQDQKRVSTPQLAFQQGADYVVMGRSLTQAQNLNSRLDSLDYLLTPPE
jgi:orotidine-5'-phosphate decarboxylase